MQQIYPYNGGKGSGFMNAIVDIKAVASARLSL